jgi:hypothetical protein
MMLRRLTIALVFSCLIPGLVFAQTSTDQRIQVPREAFRIVSIQYDANDRAKRILEVEKIDSTPVSNRVIVCAGGGCLDGTRTTFASGVSLRSGKLLAVNGERESSATDIIAISIEPVRLTSVGKVRVVYNFGSLGLLYVELEGGPGSTKNNPGLLIALNNSNYFGLPKTTIVNGSGSYFQPIRTGDVVVALGPQSSLFGETALDLTQLTVVDGDVRDLP